nr:thiol protease/hemagglutinin PrtT [Prevotella sp.]
MRSKHLHLLLLLLMMSLASFAGPRSFQQAKEIALRQAAQLGISMDETSSAKAKSKRVKSVSGEVPAYYVFPNGEGKGFTVVSGDDRLPEVVGYSDKGTYDEENLPSNYVGFMKAYEEMVGQLDNGDSRASASIAEAKALRSSGYWQPTVAPLLGSIQWNQMTPYNNMCPKYNGSDRSVTGCVATAMAQVMMYYQYPKTLQTDIPAYVSYTKHLSIPQINKGERYDWANMLPKYASYEPLNYTDAQAAAVAKLLYHCGVACEMDYGPSSGANVTPAILSTYFGYDSDLMQDLNRDVFTLAEWSQIMDKELTAKRPILYSGQSSDGGHEFVCDGTDGKGLYHINWGWGGYQDGYFDVTILNPDKGGAGSGSAPDGYNQSCSMIVGIAPDNGKEDEPLVDVAPVVMIGNGNSSLGFQMSTRNKVTDTFRVTTNNLISNQSAKDFTGYFAYGIQQADGTYKPLSNSRSISIKHPKADGSTYRQSIRLLQFDYAFPVGKTTLYGLYSTDNKKWEKCAYVYMVPFVVEATERTISVAKTPLSADIVAQDELLSEQDNTLMLTVNNDADFEHLGLIKVYTSTTNEKPSDPSEQIYFTILSKSSSTREVSVTPSAGDLYVWVTNDKGEDLMEMKKFTVTQSTAPKLVLVGKETNAIPNVYETENAYYYSYKVKGPKTNASKAVFSYKIRNDGGSYQAKFETYVYAFGENRVNNGQILSIRIKSGETATLNVEASPEDYGGNRSFYCCIVQYDSSIPFDVSGISKTKLYLVDGGWYNLDEVDQFVYVAGTPSGISSITTSGTSVSGGNGEILISSDKTQTMSVYSLSGQMVKQANVKAGENIAVSVPAGLYIVNGKKIIVK